MTCDLDPHLLLLPLLRDLLEPGVCLQVGVSPPGHRGHAAAEARPPAGPRQRLAAQLRQLHSCRPSAARAVNGTLRRCPEKVPAMAFSWLTLVNKDYKQQPVWLSMILQAAHPSPGIVKVPLPAVLVPSCGRWLPLRCLLMLMAGLAPGAMVPL